MLLDAQGGMKRLTRSSPVVAGSFRRALSEIMEDSPEPALKELKTRWNKLEPDVLEGVIQVVGEGENASALEFLCSRFGSGLEVDRLLLAEILRLARFADQGGVELALVPVRASLSREVELCRIGAQAVGMLGDVDSFEALIDLRENDDAGVREMALNSLRQLSGRSYSGGLKQWSQFLKVESAWFELESRALLAGLASDQPERVLEAVSIVCGKKLFREQFSPSVAKLLDHPLPKIRVTATLALGVLEARNTFDDLLEALEDDVQDVRTAVWRTLRRLTGKNLPLDSGAWKQAILRGA